MRRANWKLTCGTALASFAATPLVAGDEVLFGPVPDWVEIQELPDPNEEPGDLMRMADLQLRFSDGMVTVFEDRAVSLQSPEMLTSFSTLTLPWMPDKGDLTVHRIDVMREGEQLDMIEQGTNFDVLRREQGLERRSLDGILTATTNLPGLRVGDTVRISFSTTLRDQALGGEMQFSSIVPTDPIPIAKGGIRAIWDEDAGIRAGFRVSDPDLAGALVISGNEAKLDFPLPETAPLPGDAPPRFLSPPIVQFSSFEDWREVSTRFAPLFEPVEISTSDGALGALLSEVIDHSEDPLARAAYALQRVQDDVSYLTSGLDGGNYIPQSPAETWELRYGDCKAKSLLLHSLLQEAGIDSDVVLVRSTAGDLIPELVPAPGAFDHMIVRATIDGKTYWLDGTSRGTRLPNISDVPRFVYALPVTAGGADLVAMTPRPPAVADVTTVITYDQTAGIDLPALFDIEVRFNGASAVGLQTLDQLEREQRDDAISATLMGIVGPSQITEMTMEVDEENAVATLTGRGIRTTPWSWSGTRYELDPPHQVAADLDFDVDRARPEWRDLPLNLNGPVHNRSKVTFKLPAGGDDFVLQRGGSRSETIGGVLVSSDAALDGRFFTMTQVLQTDLHELPAEQIADARRGASRWGRQMPELVAASDTPYAFSDLSDRSRFAPFEAMYASLIEEAEADEAADAYRNRAAFRSGTYAWEGALADYSKAIELAPQATDYWERASIFRELDRLEEAIADLERYEELQPEGVSYIDRIILLGLAGRQDEALALGREYADYAETYEDEQRVLGHAMGWAGQADAGYDTMMAVVDTDQDQASQLNMVCWYGASRDRVTPDLLEVCRRAVAKSADSAGIRDSLALALLRNGDIEGARREFTDVVARAPQEHASRYMLGLVKIMSGDASGRDDVTTALAARPSLERLYGSFGLTVPE